MDKIIRILFYRLIDRQSIDCSSVGRSVGRSVGWFVESIGW